MNATSPTPIRAALLLAAAVLTTAVAGAALAPISAVAAPSPAPTLTPTPAPNGDGSSSIPNYDNSPNQKDFATWSLVPVGVDGKLDGRAKYSYTAEPGATITDVMGVSNFSLKPLKLKVYATDGLNTSTGQFGLLPENTKATDLGSWITPEKSTVTVPARSRKVVKFSLKIPANATPGDHVAGIVASAAADKETGKKVVTNFRTGSRVYLRVAGALSPSLAIENVQAKYKQNWNPIGRGSTDITYRVHNTGNVRLAAHQRVFVASFWGTNKVAEGVVDVPELLPGQFADLRATVKDVFPTIRAKATVELDPMTPVGVSSPAVPDVSASVWFWAPPWSLLAVVIGLILLWRADRWRSRRRTGGSSGQPGKRRAGSTPPAPSNVDVVEVPVP